MQNQIYMKKETIYTCVCVRAHTYPLVCVYMWSFRYTFRYLEVHKYKGCTEAVEYICIYIHAILEIKCY